MIAFLASHHWPAVARARRYDWLLAVPVRAGNRGPHWLPVAALAVVAVGAGALAMLFAAWLAGLFGLLLIGIAAVLYTLGPEHLDRDIRLACQAQQPERQQLALERLRIEPTSSGPEAAAASLRAALARWFGIVFWFVVLGVPGCLLYRGLGEAHANRALQGSARAWMDRALAWMNWPVVALMIGAIALMTDLDRIRATFEARADRWQLPVGLLDDLANALCDPADDLARGLADGRRLAWRALSLWFVVLSLLLLAGLLS